MRLHLALLLAAGCGFAIPSIAQYRTIDGSGNNLSNPTLGMAGTDLIRGASGAHYFDGMGMPMPRPNPRTISNAVSAQGLPGLGNSRNLSSMAWQWGQFLDHDLDLTDESTESMDIQIPAGDPVFDPANTGTAVMPFVRSVHTGGVSGPRQQQNALTHWIDGSMVYGSDNARAAALRSSGGRLATSAGDMLPYNTAGLPNGGGTGSNLYVAGDIRCNEQTGLAAMHTLFVREHNRLADQISSANPGLSDEEVYQKARKVVGAEVQAITYNEWLPAMLGNNGPAAYTGYNSAVNPCVDTAFSTAGFRLGHTMLNDQLLRYNADGTVFAGGHLNLFQQFFNPTSLATPESLDAVLRGLGRQQANEVDTQVIDSVRNLLFGGTNGRDLVALNIQRGRDHGLADYNQLRQDFGLSPVTSFGEITSNPGLAATLQAVFGDVNNIDPWIGLFAEDHLPGGSFGLTASRVLAEQFARLRDGDRFFYLNDSGLTAEDLAFLGDVTLADIIRMNTGADGVQDNIFFAIPAPSSAALLALGGLFAARRRRN